MPVASHQIAEPGGARVWIFTCEGCGWPAHFSEGADPLAALRDGDVSKAGRWYCGWRDGRPVCVTTKQASLFSTERAGE
jgi:hypothetical protein